MVPLLSIAAAVAVVAVVQVVHAISHTLAISGLLSIRPRSGGWNGSMRPCRFSPTTAAVVVISLGDAPHKAVHGEAGQVAGKFKDVKVRARPIADQRLHVQVDGDIFGRAQLDANLVAHQLVVGVDDDGLVLEDAFREDDRRSDFSVIRRLQFQLNQTL